MNEEANIACMCTQKTQWLLILIQLTQRKIHSCKHTVVSFCTCQTWSQKKLKTHYTGYNAISNAMYVEGVKRNSKYLCMLKVLKED